AISITIKGGLFFRILNLAGSIGFLLYGFIINKFPVILINIYGIGINIFHIIILIRAARKRSTNNDIA
ncbi:MAG: hypothetical protein FWD13_13050, partial [Treponema sp.]|nr:hypothetical protein [Treponema sp.]